MTVQEERSRSGVLPMVVVFAGGVVIGGVAALLLAPRSGAETRRRLSRAVDGTREAAARLPDALRAASSAAQAAFGRSLENGAHRETGADTSGPLDRDLS